uniref:uncharacterized protein LOC117256875 n=1 Tax=Epinephelus lanceolatus TaxID=310571 RepID=UPI00144592D0|nr:uncharacterized protein LOC117256875 [Epinephelus lanceolatus]
MFNVQVTSTTMKLLPVVCLCLVTRCGMTSADGNGPAVVTVEQDRDVILPCSLSTKENIESKLFDWKKAAQKDGKNKEVFFYDAGIHYNNGRAGQSEEFKGRGRVQPPRFITLKNRLDENIPGAASKPNTANLDETDNRALLQCEANGNPQPEVEWRDSAGNKLPAEEPHISERDGRFYITLNATVTKTDSYRCVATQKTINHQIHADTYVRMNGQ